MIIHPQMKAQIWDTLSKKWIDDTAQDVDKDGYCTCFVCQCQKQKEIEEAAKKLLLLPEELFEL